MNHKGRLWKAALTVCLIGCVVGAGAWLTGYFSASESPLELNSQQSAGKSSGHPEVEPGYVMVGGVKRPASDRISGDGDAAPKNDPRELEAALGYGRTPPTPADLNPQVRSTVEAIRTKTHPERLSLAIQGKPFDPKAFAANPQQYLDHPEPSRVYAVAQPAPGVPRLQSLSPYFHQIGQDESVVLAVKTAPHAPVSFSSFDLGRFENGLTAISVQANEHGVAKATFSGQPGTIEDVRILAGSPLASGQVQFVVNVQPAAGAAGAGVK